MKEEDLETIAENKAERMMQIRGSIFEAIPDEMPADELIIAGMSIFLQAALHCADQDVDKVRGLVEHVMELSQELNKMDDEEGVWPLGTVH